MYYRRKIILSILGEFGGRLSKTSFQKLLFLHSRSQKVRTYDFVPYSYGCFSFTANQDLLTLKKYGIVEELNQQSNQFWIKKDDIEYTASLLHDDYASIKTLTKDFNHYNQEELIKYTYLRYPYFAINSKIAKNILDKRELEKIENQKRAVNKEQPTIFTIGYEGKSLEYFFNQLIINAVKVLIDVRKNALSKKYGFSKSQITHVCNSLNIDYIHIPELGISSNKRKDLKDSNDYMTLFTEYEDETLLYSEKHLQSIIQCFRKNERIALMCFEMNANMCHRGRVINFLQKLLPEGVPFRNL